MNDRRPVYLLVIHLTSHFPSEQKMHPVLPVVCIIKKALYFCGFGARISVRQSGRRQKVEETVKNSNVYQCLLVNLYFFSCFSVINSLDRSICVSVSLAARSRSNQQGSQGQKWAAGPRFPHPLPILVCDHFAHRFINEYAPCTGSIIWIAAHITDLFSDWNRSAVVPFGSTCPWLGKQYVNQSSKISSKNGETNFLRTVPVS